MARFRPGDILDCPQHRALMWLGHVVCGALDGGCGAVYKSALTAPLICSECDRRLLPNSREPRDSGDQQFTGRAMCAHCYRRESAGGAAAAIDVLDDPFG